MAPAAAKTAPKTNTEACPTRSQSRPATRLATIPDKPIVVAVPADRTGVKRRSHVVARQTLADRAKDSLIGPVAHEEHADEGGVSSQRKTQVSPEENRAAENHQVLSAEAVGQEARRIGNQRRHQVEERIDQYGGRQRGADLPGLQDQKGVARITQPKNGGRREIVPVGSRKFPQADANSRFCAPRRRRLVHEQHHDEGEQTGNDGKIEDRAQRQAPHGEQEEREQRTQKCTRVVAGPFEAESSAPVGLVHRGGDERIARRGARAGAEPIEEAPAEHALPNGRDTHERLAERGQQIPEQRDGFTSLQPVGQRAG